MIDLRKKESYEGAYGAKYALHNDSPNSLADINQLPSAFANSVARAIDIQANSFN